MIISNMASSTQPKPRVALITGANRGIGCAVAERLAQEHNHHVIIGARNLQDGQAVASRLTSQGLHASALQLDITSDESTLAAVQRIQAEHGKLDVLINNAAVFVFDEPSGPQPDGLSALRDAYRRTFETNVAGTGVLTEALLPLLCQSDRPRVVFVGSEAGSLRRTLEDQSGGTVQHKVYRASKTAVHMLAVAFARDPQLRAAGAVVSVVCPGFTATGMTAPAGEEVLAAHAATPAVAAQRIVERATVVDAGSGGDDGVGTATFSDRHGAVAW